MTTFKVLSRCLVKTLRSHLSISLTEKWNPRADRAPTWGPLLAKHRGMSAEAAPPAALAQSVLRKMIFL